MQRHIFSRFFGKMANVGLAELAQYFATYYFDMRTAHFKVSGNEFLEVHGYAQELYEQAEDYYDDIIETCISLKEDFVPMYVLSKNWKPDELVFGDDVKSVVTAMRGWTQMMYDYVEAVDRERYPSFVGSKLDSIMEWLDKQCYKLGQMCGETV